MQNNTNNQAPNMVNCSRLLDVYMPINIEENPPKYVHNFWVQEECGKKCPHCDHNNCLSLNQAVIDSAKCVYHDRHNPCGEKFYVHYELG